VAVSAFETAHLLTDRPPLSPEDLAEVEGRVARDLAKRDPEALVPLLMLFERLYHEALGRRAYLLSTHDGEVVLALTALYVKQSPVPAAGSPAPPGAPVSASRSLAAGFLVGLARGRLEGGVNSFCRRALERALTYDEGNEAALLALAVDAGRRGNPREAAELLERLLRHHPESLEGRLRLALAETRLGHADRARHRLGEIVATPPASPTNGNPGDPWLLSLAYQELARLERSGGEPGAAAQILEAGLTRLPGDGELLLERAALLDRRGEHGRARETLEAVQAQTEGGSTPRHRYNLPPEAAFDRAWNALEAGAAERRRAFGAAVAEHAAKGQP
jgi:tetratricopeptide (TPR) repeat protein